MSQRTCQRLTIVATLVLSGAAACTKVREQPAARPVEVAAPAPVKVAKPVRRPTSSPWPSRPDPAERPAAAALPAEAVGEGTPFSRAKLQTALEAALPGLNPCWPNGTVASATVSFDATSAGKAENVRVAGASSPAQEKCVAEHLGGLKLPSFDGPPVGVQLPITVGLRGLTQPADPTTPGAAAAVPSTAPASPTAAAAPAPAAPRLFVTP
jgi:hypothetical protein